MTGKAGQITIRGTVCGTTPQLDLPLNHLHAIRHHSIADDTLQFVTNGDLGWSL